MSTLERRLAELAPHTAFPETPALAARVARSLETRRDISVRVPEGRRRGRWVPALVAALVILLTVGLVVSPGARRAVADFLGIGGVRIETIDRPSSEPAPGRELGLGRPVSVLEAQAEAGFPLRAIDPGLLGEPAAAYLASADGFSQVAFVYEAGSGDTVLLQQFKGSPDEAYFKKLSSIPGEGVTPVDVNGAFGFWLEGPHTIEYRGPDGDLETHDSRLAGNTLLWEVDGITYRLESDLSMDRALELAESVG